MVLLTTVSCSNCGIPHALDSMCCVCRSAAQIVVTYSIYLLTCITVEAAAERSGIAAQQQRTTPRAHGAVACTHRRQIANTAWRWHELHDRLRVLFNHNRYESSANLDLKQRVAFCRRMSDANAVAESFAHRRRRTISAVRCHGSHGRLRALNDRNRYESSANLDLKQRVAFCRRMSGVDAVAESFAHRRRRTISAVRCHGSHGRLRALNDRNRNESSANLDLKLIYYGCFPDWILHTGNGRCQVDDGRGLDR